MKPFVIGLSGLSGSGKTFYINHLKQILGSNLALISLDDYYKPHHLQQKDENGVMNFDVPSALYSDLYCEHLQQLIKGKKVVKEQYQFEIENPETKIITINPAPVIITEGLFIYEFEPIRNLLDYKIFLTCDYQTCLNRRLERDVQERGIPKERSLYQWNNHVLPAYNQYILPHKPICDTVYENHGKPTQNLKHLSAVIHNQIPNLM